MAAKRITNEIRERVHEMSRQGVPYWRIAQELGISEYDVIQILGIQH